MGGTHFQHKTENLSDFNGIHCHVVSFLSFSSTINFNRCAWLIRVHLWRRSKYLFSWSQWVPLLRITFWLLLPFCINILFAFQLTHDEWAKSLTTKARFQMRSYKMSFQGAFKYCSAEFQKWNLNLHWDLVQVWDRTFRRRAVDHRNLHIVYCLKSWYIDNLKFVYYPMKSLYWYIGYPVICLYCCNRKLLSKIKFGASEASLHTNFSLPFR